MPKQLPEGVTPPLVLTYSASSVPALDLQVSSDQLTGAELYTVADVHALRVFVSVPRIMRMTWYRA